MLSVQAWTGRLKLDRSPSQNVDTNATVVFTAGADEPKVVFAITQWKWKPDSGTTGVVSTCGASISCSYKPQASGTMWVYGTVNGVPDSASNQVIRIPCPTQDDFLDRQNLRDSLAKLWQLSNGSNSNFSLRRERGLAMYDSAGKTLIRILPLDTSATPCETHLPTPVPSPGRLLMEAHVHPFTPGDLLPSNCKFKKPPPPGKAYAYGPGVGGMFSDKDWEHTQVPPRHPIFAFDRDSVFRGDTLVTLVEKPDGTFAPDSTWEVNYHSWTRQRPSCKVIM